MWGPPGTGKTMILVGVAERAGLMMTIGQNANGMSFAESLVGETSKVITKAVNRAKHLPWLPCGVLIDEMETLVPNRFAAGTKDKNSDALITLLSLFGGGENVPNVYFFGCTNKPTDMDPAFLRRMTYKFYCGFLPPQSRFFMLRKKAGLYIEGDEAGKKKLLDELCRITTNFSGAKLGTLSDNLVKTALRSGRQLNLAMLKRGVRDFCYSEVRTGTDTCLRACVCVECVCICTVPAVAVCSKDLTRSCGCVVDAPSRRTSTSPNACSWTTSTTRLAPIWARPCLVCCTMTASSQTQARAGRPPRSLLRPAGSSWS